MPNENNTDKTANNEVPKQEMTQAAIEKTLREGEKYKTYFDNYNNFSVETFIKNYALQKWMWWQYGKGYVTAHQNADQYLIDTASKHLEIIQQKKLFDVQCRWRAEQMVVREVEICFDFVAWQQNVMHCPFIEPVTQQDVELYQRYLTTTNIDFNDEFFYFNDWQDYDALKNAYQDEVDSTFNFPEWYEYHNIHTGAGTLMLLPDIRGNKEAFYKAKDYEARAEEIKQHQEAFDKKRDSRPYIFTHDDEQLENFINTFEDKLTKIYYRAYKRENRNKEEEEELYDIVDYLLNYDKPVAIEGHHDFREALRMAQNRIKASKLLEFLPFAFDEYQIARSMGFGPSDEVLKRFDWHINNLKPHYTERILNGRKTCGEPENFDF